MGTDLSLIHLFLNASILVQFVMVLLLGASIVSWTFIFQRANYLAQAKLKHKRFEEKFWSGIDLNQLYQDSVSKSQDLSASEKVFVAGFKEYLRAVKNGGEIDQQMEGINRAMQVNLTRQVARLETHLPFLATVQSNCPYIGLFGTVWGIIHALRGLANESQASISMVAPGMSEALVATAMGLIAAIPAGIAYNRFSMQVNHLAEQMDLFKDEFAGILQRQLLAQQQRQQQAAEQPEAEEKA